MKLLLSTFHFIIEYFVKLLYCKYISNIFKQASSLVYKKNIFIILNIFYSEPLMLTMLYLIQTLWYVFALILIVLILIQNPQKNNILSQQEKSLQTSTWRSIFIFLLMTILLSVIQ